MSRILEGFVDALAFANRLYLERHPATPNIYDSGVVYELQEPDVLLDVPEILAQGHADCLCLSAWLMAQLVVRDGYAPERVRPHVTHEEESAPGIHRFHVAVLINLVGPEGRSYRVLDPSVRMGMNS